MRVKKVILSFLMMAIIFMSGFPSSAVEVTPMYVPHSCHEGPFHAICD